VASIGAGVTSTPHRVRAIVFGCLLPGELRLLLEAGAEMADGGAPLEVPTVLVPVTLRTPNTRLWVDLDKEWRVISASARYDE
jgi:hypothetical protein